MIYALRRGLVWLSFTRRLTFADLFLISFAPQLDLWPGLIFLGVGFTAFTFIGHWAASPEERRHDSRFTHD